jgi:hypothetical protein
MNKIQLANLKRKKIQSVIDKVISSRWLLTFAALFSFFFFWGRYNSFTFILLASSFIALFIASSFFYASLVRKLTKWETYLDILKLEKNRKALNWKELPKYRSPAIEVEELDYITATDLNLLGEHSVLHLMDNSISDFGQKTLVGHLLSKKEPIKKIIKRQKKVKELLPLIIFRMKFKLLGKLHSNALIKKEELFSAFGVRFLNKLFLSLFSLLVIVQLINAILMLCSMVGEMKPYYLLSSPLIFLIYQLLKNQSANAFEEGLHLQISLERLFPVFNLMECLSIKKDDALFEEFESFQKGPPSRLLKQVNWVVALLSVRANPLLGLILNFLLPWDFGLLIFLEKLKSKNGPHLKHWMDSLGRLEALVSLADYADLNRGVFPNFLESGYAHYLVAADVGHPLMASDKRITNTYVIEKKSPVAIITGSNMAGKSTFLRTVGLNIALAKAGTTVLAQDFQLQNLSVKSLIKAQDFLEKEMSLFYFEVKRLKEILEEGRESSKEFPFLFLVDEIYRGTNNEERYQGAVAYLKEFSKTPGCCGLLTTHDINIAKSLEEGESFKHYHFKEMFKDGILVYDYKINQGICDTTNALRIMEKEGLPV